MIPNNTFAAIQEGIFANFKGWAKDDKRNLQLIKYLNIQYDRIHFRLFRHLDMLLQSTPSSLGYYTVPPHIIDDLVVLVLSYNLSVSNCIVPDIYFCVLGRKLILEQEQSRPHCMEFLGFTVLLSTYHVMNYTDTSVLLSI